jgi:ABC-type glycerol-3-phosphate transport system substrate-binding protein
VARLALALVLALTLAGCGSSKTSAPPGDVVFQGSEWAVAVDGGKATAYRLVDGEWQADTSGAVKVAVLGPKPGSQVPATPQVAIEMRAPTALVESALWVDGTELLEKGGGSPTRGTIYGAPAAPLAPGEHTAVAYARTGANATAVAWTFHV